MSIRYILLLFLASCGMAATAQQETYDLVSYTTPARWQKKEDQNVLQLQTGEQAKKNYTAVVIFKSVATKADAQQNFTDCWENILKKTATITDAPKMAEPAESDGWKIVSGSAAYTDGKDKGGAMQLTATGYGRRINIVVFSNTFIHQKAIDFLFNSIHFIKPASNGTATQPAAVTPPKSTISGYKFTTTNFDNGWMATQQASWVQLTKGPITALLHYPDAVTEKYYSYSTDAARANWEHLVAGRYASISNVRVYAQSGIAYTPAMLVAANVQDKTSGKNLYVVLFQRDKSYWTEFIAADKNTFVQSIGIDVDVLDPMAANATFDPLSALSDMNRFAIAASDLIGAWSSSTASSVAYVSVYTGAYAGGTVAGVNSEYHFLSGNQYTSTHNGGYGTAGNMQTYKKSYKGSATVTSWSISLSNREKGATEKFDAFFVASRAGRLLVIRNENGYSYTLGKVSK